MNNLDNMVSEDLETNKSLDDTQQQIDKKDINKKKIEQFLKFLFFSLGAGIIQITTFSVCQLFRLPVWISHTVAISLSVLFNFTINRKFTFQAANNVALAMILVGIFYLFFGPFSIWFMYYFPKTYGHKFLFEISIMVTNFVTEFLYNKFVVYGKKLNKNVSNIK